MLKKIYKILIGPYVIMLLYFMFFGFGRTQFDGNIVRIVPLVSTIKFGESSLVWSQWPMFLVNVFGNILMFLPFGFLGWVFPKFRHFNPLLLTFLSFIIIVEALQYFTRMGVFDVDDILFNTFGVWLGFKIFSKLKTIYHP